MTWLAILFFSQAVTLGGVQSAPPPINDSSFLEVARQAAELASKAASSSDTERGRAYAHLCAARAWRPLDSTRAVEHLEAFWKVRSGPGQFGTATRDALLLWWLLDRSQAQAKGAEAGSTAPPLPTPGTSKNWLEDYRFAQELVDRIDSGDLSGGLLAIESAPRDEQLNILEEFAGLLWRYDFRLADKFQRRLGIKEGWQRSTLISVSSSSDIEFAVQVLKEKGGTRLDELELRLKGREPDDATSKWAAELAEGLARTDAEELLRSNDERLTLIVKHNPKAAAQLLTRASAYVREKISSDKDFNPRQLLSVAGLMASINMDEALELVDIATSHEKTAALRSDHNTGESIVGGYYTLLLRLTKKDAIKAAEYLRRDVAPWEPKLADRFVSSTVQLLVRERDPAGLELANQFDGVSVKQAVENGLLLAQLDSDPKKVKTILPLLKLEGHENSYMRWQIRTEVLERLWAADPDCLEDTFPEMDGVADFLIGQVKSALSTNRSKALKLAQRAMLACSRVSSPDHQADMFSKLSLTTNPKSRDVSLFDTLVSQALSHEKSPSKGGP